MKAQRRNKLPRSAFAYKRSRKYPIDTPKRARAALSRAAQSKTSGTYQHVARRVRARYGNKIKSVSRSKGVTNRAGYRRKTRRRR